MTAPETGPDGGTRTSYLIGVTKLPPAERDLFRALCPDEAALDTHGWRDALGAHDDDTGVPVGEPAVYAIELSPDEVRDIADADVSNLRWLELEPAPLPPIRPRGRPLLDVPVPPPHPGAPAPFTEPGATP